MATQTDTFDRANSTDLGTDWSEDAGNWEISSNNLLNGTTGTYFKCRWVGAAMDSNNYYVEVVARSGVYTHGIGPAARLAASSAVTYYTYMIFGGDRAYLLRITNGSETILATGSNITANTNYTLRLEVNGSTIRGYLNGTLDVSATDSNLTSGPPGVAAYGGNNSNTYITTWTASDLSSGTTYNQSAAGGLTLAGTLVRQNRKTPAGSLGLTGAIVRQSRKTLAGSLGLAGTTIKRTGKTLAGSLGLAGALSTLRTSYIAASGSLGLSGTTIKRTGKILTGSLGLSGSLLKRVAKILTGALVTAGSVAAQLIGGVIQVAVSGVLSLAGTVQKRTNKTLAGSLPLSGEIAKRISKLLSGALNFTKRLTWTLFGPSAFKADAVLTDVAPYTATVTNVAPFTATVTNVAPFTATVMDEA